MPLEHPLKLLLSRANTKVVQYNVAFGILEFFGVDDLLPGSSDEFRVFRIGRGSGGVVIVGLVAKVLDDLLDGLLYRGGVRCAAVVLTII